MLPTEWQIIYSHIHLNKISNKIMLPISTDEIDYYEDTFGAERSNKRKHQGMDIFAPIFTPVVSVNDGIIIKTGTDILGGNIIKILGEDNRIYYYAHLNTFLKFKDGDKIQRGEKIGFVGHSGNAIFTPPHLHFEIMEIEWLLPLITKNINPYMELADTSSVNYNFFNK